MPLFSAYPPSVAKSPTQLSARMWLSPSSLQHTGGNVNAWSDPAGGHQFSVTGTPAPAYQALTGYSLNDAGFGTGTAPVLFVASATDRLDFAAFTVAVVARVVMVAGDTTDMQRVAFSTANPDVNDLRGRGWELFMTPTAAGTYKWVLKCYDMDMLAAGEVDGSTYTDGDLVVVVGSVSSGTAALYTARIGDTSSPLTASTINGTVRYSALATASGYNQVSRVGRGDLRATNRGEHFSGDIAHVALFDRQLTGDEVNQLVLYFRQSLMSAQEAIGSVTLTLDNSTIRRNGTTQARAVVHGTSGAILTGRPITWSVSDATKISIYDSGSVYGIVIVNGLAVYTGSGLTVTATCGDHFATVPITVTAEQAYDAVVAFDRAGPYYPGQTLDGTLTVRNDFGTSLDPNVPVVFSSLDTAKATIQSIGRDGSGHSRFRITFLQAVLCRFQADFDGRTTSFDRTVAVSGAHVVVTLAASDIFLNGATIASVALYDDDGSSVDPALQNVRFTLSDPSVANISRLYGDIGAAWPGTTQVIATWLERGLNGSAPLTVRQAPTVLPPEPPNAVFGLAMDPATVRAGQTAEAQVYADGLALDNGDSPAAYRELTWSWTSSDPTVATVGNLSGYGHAQVFAHKVGTAVITATAGSRTCSATITVAGTPVSLSFDFQAYNGTVTLFPDGARVMNHLYSKNGMYPGFVAIVDALSGADISGDFSVAFTALTPTMATIAADGRDSESRPKCLFTLLGADGESRYRATITDTTGTHLAAPFVQDLTIGIGDPLPPVLDLASFKYIDNWLTWAEPRKGGFPETGFPSGLQAAWQMPTDYFCSFDARWVEPVADGTLGEAETGVNLNRNTWNTVLGVRKKIEDMRKKGTVLLYPDRHNPDLFFTVTLVEPLTGGVVLESDGTRKISFVFRSSAEITGF
jgi:hypothetical protein